PALNDSGQAVFLAELANTTGGNMDNQGIFRGDGTVLTQIARAGQTSPDGNGVLTFSINYPSINSTGQVAFWTELASTNDTLPYDQGIFLGDGTVLIQIARSGQPILPGSTNRFCFFGGEGLSEPAVSINEQGRVTFWATFSDIFEDPLFRPP